MITRVIYTIFLRVSPNNLINNIDYVLPNQSLLKKLDPIYINHELNGIVVDEKLDASKWLSVLYSEHPRKNKPVKENINQSMLFYRIATRGRYKIDYTSK